MLRYEPIKEEDYQTLTAIMKAAFDDDTRMHTSLSEDGPRGYDDGSLIRRLCTSPNHASEKILFDGQVVGAYTVSFRKQSYTLELLFLNPQLKNQGLGYEAWTHIEAAYQDASEWRTETPAYSTRNRRFYVDKCGFRVLSALTHENGGQSLLLYKTHSPQGQPQGSPETANISGFPEHQPYKITDGKPYLAEIRALIVEYTTTLGRDLTFQHLDEELNNLAAHYTAPGCRLLAAVTEDETVIGCVACHRLTETRCEMKRLYVKPAHRGQKTGDRLIQELLRLAAQDGYTEMVLDTLKPLQSAIHLYQKHGFQETEKYYENPMPDVIYMKLPL